MFWPFTAMFREVFNNEEYINASLKMTKKGRNVQEVYHLLFTIVSNYGADVGIYGVLEKIAASILRAEVSTFGIRIPICYISRVANKKWDAWVV
jgi:hypothetical protein